ncbi:MAG: helix-turn-helix domain-containing protein [Verrucomicrobiae bacterium]|nr:helix-turn-helix domain-containing protein [Verrucomicrobiae bacterium]
MKGLRPLLLEDLQIAAPGLTVLRLCVNRHLPETHWVRSHRHRYAQILAYLSGSGWQLVEEERIPVSTGRIIGIPAGVSHAFEKERARSPLCLVVDLKMESNRLAKLQTRILNAEARAEIQSCLTWLAKQRSERGMLRVREAGVVLQVAGLLAESLATSGSGELSSGRGASSRFVERVRKYLCATEPDIWNGEAVAEALDMQRDHLNRLLKQECGLTAGQLIAEHRLDLARRGLESSGREIQEVAVSVGMLDRNYFARWFRKQTGLTPSVWRRRHGR